ncbi:MAG TPA: TIGR00730 family Rossman fold protein [Terriglobales bacterium]|nr:TIGR00730 family Rossman fold protein [Terriglobales bacterium]
MTDQKKPEAAIAPLAYENKNFLHAPDGRGIRIMSEYYEPLARFRKERIQDTIVFFGSARFHSRSEAESALLLLEKDGSRTPAPPQEQKLVQRAKAAVEMARYYEDARKLSFMLTRWSMTLPGKRHRFVITSGGGPGIMEAANLGAYEAGGKTIGMNIRLPYEQMPNCYITPSLNFEFHYFFMRKYWFAYLAKALVIFPGGFGTMDELFEILTLAQTQKLAKKILVIIYGRRFWKRIINLNALIDSGTISPDDKDLFRMADTPEEAFATLKNGLTKFHLQAPPPTKEKAPEIAKTRG